MSNWSIPYLEDLSKTWKVVPAINQVENHPFNPQHDLHEYCRNKGILLQAYCPLGSTNSPLLKDEELLRIAKKNAVSPATILISYQVNRGIVVLPKSVTSSRSYRTSYPIQSIRLRPSLAGITDNLKTIKLDDDDMKVLNEMAANGRQQRVNTPLFGWDLVRFLFLAFFPFSLRGADFYCDRGSMTGTVSETRMRRTRRL